MCVPETAWRQHDMGAYSTTTKPTATNRLTLTCEFDHEWDKDGFHYVYTDADNDLRIEARHKNIGEDFAAYIEITVFHCKETFVFEAVGIEQANAILSAFDLGRWVK